MQNGMTLFPDSILVETLRKVIFRLGIGLLYVTINDWKFDISLEFFAYLFLISVRINAKNAF